MVEGTWIREKLRPALFECGFTLVAKTHGNRFQLGWPDLWCRHPDLGGKWVEAKTKGGRLTAAQHQVFASWYERGEPIWVVQPKDLGNLFPLLAGPCNVTEWLKRRPQRVRAPREWT